jgi:hypothetical protein
MVLAAFLHRLLWRSLFEVTGRSPLEQACSILSVAAIAALLAGCNGARGGSAALPAGTTGTSVTRGSTGLGKVLTIENGYQVAGFDIDQSGTDGILATGSSIEIFDQDTGTILKSFPKTDPPGTSYGMNAISTGDIGLVTRYVVPKGQIYAKRFYDVLNPVTAQRFTGKWTPPVKDIQVEQEGPNQTVSSTALYAIELKNQDAPLLIVSDIAKNTFSKVIRLSSAYTLGDQPQLAQDTATNQAIFAYSPDGGAAGGDPPINAIIDMKTGKIKQFSGYNKGYAHAGDVNGMAVDPATGVEATDTELNAEVEFYDLATETGITAVQLPCTGSGSQLASGAGMVNDSKNQLFLVAETEYCNSNGAGAIVVYDEQGNLKETITGFNMAIAEPAPVINPSKRMGWALGPHLNQLQQFFY